MKKLYSRFKPVVFTKTNFGNGSFLLTGTLMMLLVFGMASISMAATEYDASDVDSPPKIVRQMPVKYPAQAKQNGITGKVIIRCLIGTDGKTEKMEVVESEPAGIFDDSALSTLKNWQFRPGIKNGELVATWIKVPFKFE